MPLFIKTLVLRLAKNLIKMLTGKDPVFWALNEAAKYTDNKIDDQAVPLVEALYDGDYEKFKLHAEALTKALNDTSGQ